MAPGAYGEARQRERRSVAKTKFTPAFANNQTKGYPK